MWTAAQKKIIADLKSHKDFTAAEATCTTNIDRMSDSLNNQFSKYEGTGVPFTDWTFPATQSSLWWDGHLWDNEMKNRYVNVKSWERPSKIEAEDDKKVSMWGSTGIRPAAVQQGSLGDCWFLASAAGIAEYPARIEKIFTNKDYSKEGIF